MDVLCHNSGAIAFWKSVGFTDYSLSLEIFPNSRPPRSLFDLKEPTEARRRSMKSANVHLTSLDLPVAGRFIPELREATKKEFGEPPK